MIQLRPYQGSAVDEVRAAFRAGRRAVLFVLPTGGGKTVVFTYVAHSAHSKGNRVVALAHRQEIVEQISASFTGMGVAHGLVMPGAPMTDDPVQVAMVQTLARRLDMVTEPDLLIIDEAHHGVAGLWQKVRDRWRNAMVLGVTATPERRDGKPLGDAFDAMVVGPTPAELVADGHLAGFDYYAPESGIDLSGVPTPGGDFAVGELAEVMDTAPITGDAVEHYGQHLAGKPAIAFCVTVAHAEHVAEQFRAAGFRAASVDGSMSKAERRDRILSLADGRLNVLTSCELISEGVDVPVVSGAILLRPTKSLALYLQQVGRCLRKKPDGSRAVILDHVGNVFRHGLPDAPREWSLEGRKKRLQAFRVSTCKLCFRTVADGSRPSCDGVDGEACPLANPDPADTPEAPEVVEGRLHRITDPLAWAQGIDIAKATGATWWRLVDLVQTIEQAKQIQKARGYRRGWAQHFFLELGRVRAEVDRIIALPSRPGLASVSDSVLWTLLRRLKAEGPPTRFLLIEANAEVFRRRQRKERAA